MKIIILLIGVLLLTAGQVCAEFEWYLTANRGADSVAITSLPYTISTGGTSGTKTLKVYYLTGNLNAAAGGISVSGERDWWEVNGQNYTITFDKDSAGGCDGIALSNNCDHFIIRNLTVTQYQTANAVESGSKGGSDVYAINMGVTLDWGALLNVSAHVYGHSSKNVNASESGPTVYGMEIKGGDYTSYSNSFDSRHSLDGAAVTLRQYRDDTPWDTANWWVHGITIQDAPHAGLLVGGVAWVDSNSVTIDGRNESGASWANCHAIADLGTCYEGSRFRYNTIRTGTSHGGGRGMYFNFTEGTADHPVEMAYNDIRVNQGNSSEDEGARGLRIRWGVMYLRVHHNYIEVSCDDDPNTTYKGANAHGIWFGAIGEESSDTSANNWIYNNEIHATFDLTGTDTTTQCVAIIIDQLQDPSNPFGNGNRFFGNKLYSNVRVYQFGDDYHPADHIIVYRDTINWQSPRYTCGYGWHEAVGVGTGPHTCVDNWVVDPVYVNADSNDVGHRSSGGTQSWWLARTVRVNARTDDGVPLVGATVYIRNSYMDTIATLSTNDQGYALDTVPYRYERWSSDSRTNDSSFNPIKIFVTTGTDTDSSSATVLTDQQYPGVDFPITVSGLSGGTRGDLDRAVQATVYGANDWPVQWAAVTFTDTFGVATVDTTDGWGNVFDTLPVSRNDSLFNPYTITVVKYGWDTATSGYIYDTVEYNTRLSLDSADVDGPQLFNDTLGSLLGQDPERISIMFAHYSNGDIGLSGTCWNASYHKNILYWLDTLIVHNLVGDTGRIAFRSYNLNADAGGYTGTALSDTVVGTGENGCQFDRIANSSHGWGGDHNRMMIWNRQDNGPASGNDDLELAGLLTYFFRVSGKTDEDWWAPFRTVELADGTVEPDGFDIFMVKQPQRAYGCADDCDTTMMRLRCDSLKILWQQVYDSCAAHPQTQWILVFGVPYDDDVGNIDSAEAKLLGGLLNWWNDTLPTVRPASNVWLFDSFSPLMQWESGHFMEAGHAVKYMFADSVTDSDNHMLASVGASLFQDTLVPFLQTVCDSVLTWRRTGAAAEEEEGDPPVANFYGTPTTIDSGETVSFYDQSTNTPTEWDWDFGDGSTHGTTENPTHTYDSVGVFTVVLTATNEYGSDDYTRTNYITVQSPSPATTAKRIKLRR